MKILSSKDRTIQDISEIESGKVYDDSDMRRIWSKMEKSKSFWYDHLFVSRDGGTSFEKAPSVDTGKWYYRGWLFLWLD